MRTRSLASIAALGLVVAACSAAGSAVPPSSTIGDQVDAVPAATSGSDGQVDSGQNPTGPSAELLSYFFPISGAELASVNYIAREANNQAMRQLGQCISNDGFNLDFNSTIPPDLVPRFASYPAYESLRKYGFNMQRPPGFPPGLAYVEDVQNAVNDGLALPDGISQSEAQALVETYNNCAVAQEQGEAIPPLILIEATYRDLDLNFDLLLDEIDVSDQRVVEAFQSFHACVAERGWQLDLVAGDGSQAVNDTPFFAAVDTAVLSEADASTQRELELTAAADYADCMQPVEEARQPLRSQLRDQYVDDNLADLIEMEVQFREALHQLGVGS